MDREFVCLNPEVSRRKLIQGLAGTGILLGITSGIHVASPRFDHGEPSISQADVPANPSRKRRTVGYLYLTVQTRSMWEVRTKCSGRRAWTEGMMTNHRYSGTAQLPRRRHLLEPKMD
jgi:hypothetical protein